MPLPPWPHYEPDEIDAAVASFPVPFVEQEHGRFQSKLFPFYFDPVGR